MHNQPPRLAFASSALALLWLFVSSLAPSSRADEPVLERTAIFPANPKHNHASCVVETKSGRLLAVWYAGSGERKSDDVVIEGAWRNRGESRWGPKFLMADTPGYPDCNPALFSAPDDSLWLFWPTILDHRWEGALLKYAKCDRPGDGPGPPRCSRTAVLHVTPQDFAVKVRRAIDGLPDSEKTRYRKQLALVEERSRDELYQRLGWMPRVHAVALPSGRWILPLYSDTFSCSIMAISDDRGESWRASEPLVGFGNIQPSLVRKNDGAIVAFMRDNGPHRRIRLSTSPDNGVMWSPVTDSPFPNPGAGIEAIRLANGHWVLVYNDTPLGRHSLAISVSDDEGATWKWTRHLERMAPGQGQFHYPSLMQAADGSIHVTYTHRPTGQGSTIEHVRLNETWLLEPEKHRE
jgi:predicted neuraminidase